MCPCAVTADPGPVTTGQWPLVGDPRAARSWNFPASTFGPAKVEALRPGAAGVGVGTDDTVPRTKPVAPSAAQKSVFWPLLFIWEASALLITDQEAPLPPP